MYYLKRITALSLMVLLVFSLSACGKEKKEDLFSEENYENRSDKVVDDGWTDGIDDKYIFEYELVIEPKSKIEGVIVTGILDKGTKDVQIMKTRVSRFNDPKTIVGIGSGAFANQKAIEKVSLSDTVVMIMEGAFEGCTSLKTVEMTSAVWLLEKNIFFGCTSLETIRYSGTMAEFELIQIEDSLVPAGQSLTIACKDGSFTMDDAGKSVAASEDVNNADSNSTQKEQGHNLFSH